MKGSKLFGNWKIESFKLMIKTTVTYLILNIYLDISFNQFMDNLHITFLSSNDQGGLTILM